MAQFQAGWLSARKSFASDTNNHSSVNRWVYTAVPLVIRHWQIDVPILILPTAEVVYNRYAPSSSDIFEQTRAELQALSPLSHSATFLLLGFL